MVVELVCGSDERNVKDGSDKIGHRQGDADGMSCPETKLVAGAGGTSSGKKRQSRFKSGERRREQQ
jgi:hypothetical protein